MVSESASTPLLVCCTTWVNSCASRCLDELECVEYCPGPKTMSLPTVYARASIASAESAAMASACTRTLLKSCSKRDSKNDRVADSSGCPDEPSTSCTIGGAVLGPTDPVECCCNAPLLFLHSSHPPPFVCRPQAHL